jgi:hypothetical protein
LLSNIISFAKINDSILLTIYLSSLHAQTPTHRVPWCSSNMK